MADPRDILLELARTKMPFGRYAGKLLLDLPEPYVLWLARHDVAHGRLGLLLGTLLEVKINGLEPLLAPLRPPPEDGRR